MQNPVRRVCVWLRDARAEPFDHDCRLILFATCVLGGCCGGLGKGFGWYVWLGVVSECGCEGTVGMVELFYRGALSLSLSFSPLPPPKNCRFYYRKGREVVLRKKTARLA